MYKRERSHQRENSYPQRRRTPSFSSSLLDAIYRSIDESNGGNDDQQHSCQKAMSRKQRNYSYPCREEEEDEANLGRTIMIENWVGKQSNHRTRLQLNSSTSTSSDSSSSGCGGGLFSSSEAESTYSDKKSRRSKPVSRSMKCMPFELQRNDAGEAPHRRQLKQSKRENSVTSGGGGFTKTKLKALKIYGDLKKVKQPISPGGRITNFLNSIFSSGNSKKVNVCSVKAMEDVNYESKSWTPSSSSLKSKYPNSSSNGVKRSVRFYPVGVIVDEDSRPCGHKSICEDEYENPIPSLVLPSTNVQRITKSCSLREKNNHVRNSKKVSLSELVSRSFGDDDDDEDEMSCSSSDLFELDHVIGIGGYREELPVYETTNMKTNQAIANAFLF